MHVVDTIAVTMCGWAISYSVVHVTQLLKHSIDCPVLLLNPFALTGKEDTFETSQLVDSKLKPIIFNEIKVTV